MKYISWILPSGHTHSQDQTMITEEIAAAYADLFPNTMFFYTDEKISTEDYEDRSWVRRLARRPYNPENSSERV